jgi:hypothetical protein
MPPADFSERRRALSSAVQIFYLVLIMALGFIGMSLYNLLFQHPLAPPFDF